MMLPIVMEYNADCTGEKYREIARAMGVKGVDEMLAHKPLSPEEMTAFVQRSNEIMMLLTKIFMHGSARSEEIKSDLMKVVRI